MGLGHFLLEIGKCPSNSHLNPAIDVLALFSSNTVITVITAKTEYPLSMMELDVFYRPYLEPSLMMRT